MSWRESICRAYSDFSQAAGRIDRCWKKHVFFSQDFCLTVPKKTAYTCSPVTHCSWHFVLKTSTNNEQTLLTFCSFHLTIFFYIVCNECTPTVIQGKIKNKHEVYLWGRSWQKQKISLNIPYLWIILSPLRWFRQKINVVFYITYLKRDRREDFKQKPDLPSPAISKYILFVI